MSLFSSFVQWFFGINNCFSYINESNVSKSDGVEMWRWKYVKNLFLQLLNLYMIRIWRKNKSHLSSTSQWMNNLMHSAVVTICWYILAFARSNWGAMTWKRIIPQIITEHFPYVFNWKCEHDIYFFLWKLERTVVWTY